MRFGSYRRYVVTEVKDHWETVKPAFRITLADGTELVASGDHVTTEHGAQTIEGWIRQRHVSNLQARFAAGYNGGESPPLRRTVGSRTAANPGNGARGESDPRNRTRESETHGRPVGKPLGHPIG